MALVLFAVVLLLLLVFILENSQRVDISYFGAHGHLPLGVALLLAAVLAATRVVTRREMLMSWHFPCLSC